MSVNIHISTESAPRSRNKILVLAVLAVLSLIVISILLIFLGKIGLKTHYQKQETASVKLVSLLDQFIFKFEESSRTIAENPYIRKRLLLHSRSGPSMDKKELADAEHNIQVVLRSIKLASNASIVYIMDPNGLVIASSTLDGNQTLVGSNYKFRPYFQEAIIGNNYIYAALGVTTNKRGLYFSSPVLNHVGNRPIGVVVIKMGLEHIDKIMRRSHNITGLMSPDGIIFSTNKPRWMYNVALPITKKRLEELKNIKQFGTQPLTSLPFFLNAKTIEIENETQSVTKKNTAIPGWTFFSIKDLNGTYPIDWAILLTLFTLFTAFLIGSNLLNTQKKKMLEADKKKAEDEIWKQNKFLNTILDSLSYPLYLINLEDYSIELANNASKSDAFKDKITCYSLSHGNDKPCWELNSKYPCPAQEIRKTAKPVIVEHTHLTPEGKENNFEVHAYPIKDENGKATKMLEYAIDITHRKEMEEELLKTRQLESIGILAGGIAHDFNNILSVIIGNITLVKDELNPNNINYKFLNQAEDSALKAAELAQKLTTFSRGGWLHKEKVTLRFILEELVENITHHENKKSAGNNAEISFVQNFPGTLWPVYADRSRLKQALLNIITNSIEAAVKSKNTITISAENIMNPGRDIPGFESLPHQRENTYVKLSINDKGTGIPRNDLSKIFVPYFSTKSLGDKKGTGLGLTLCYSIIKKHKGYISVQSNESIGTTVDVFLPAYREE
jgi:C4-dicarboxylate-specific signal transduction histidine kinase